MVILFKIKIKTRIKFYLPLNLHRSIISFKNFSCKKNLSIFKKNHVKNSFKIYNTNKNSVHEVSLFL